MSTVMNASKIMWERQLGLSNTASLNIGDLAIRSPQYRDILKSTPTHLTGMKPPSWDTTMTGSAGVYVRPSK